jgi:hypothetical protein
MKRSLAVHFENIHVAVDYDGIDALCSERFGHMRERFAGHALREPKDILTVSANFSGLRFGNDLLQGGEAHARSSRFAEHREEFAAIHLGYSLRLRRHDWRQFPDLLAIFDFREFLT